jgi:aminopeptidase
MPDPRMMNLAKILVEYSVKVEPNDTVAIIGTHLAEPLIHAVFREVLRAGGHPQTFVTLPDTPHIYMSEATDDQLEYVSPVYEIVYAEYDRMIQFFSDANTRSLTNIDPARQSIRSKAMAPLMETYMKRFASGDLRWVLSMYPTDAYAQDAEMSLTEFEEYLFSTTFADTDDPVARWEQVFKEQDRLTKWLAEKSEVKVKGPNVDLTLSIADRKFISANGLNNMPDGEIYTSPVEESANGWIRFTYPAIRIGREVEGIELHFEEGKVVKASAEKNEEFLLASLDIDEGARYLGEFAIGTNKRINRFIKNLLFDEKIGGTIHLAVGFSIEETGGKNKSAIHWDMLCDMHDGGQIFVDDELFYESGEFKI